MEFETVSSSERRTVDALSEMRTEKKERFRSFGKQHLDDRFPNNEKGYRFWLNKSPIRMYPGWELPKSLTPAEVGYIYRCAMMMETQTNMLKHHVDGRDKPLTMPQLAMRLDMSLNYCYRFVGKMCDMGVMAREDGRIYINPVYFFRGVNLKQHLFFVFEEWIAGLLPHWVVERFYGRGF